MKQTIITILFAIVAMAGQAQTKTAIIKGYSPMLKNGTEAVCTIDMVRVATDTVHAGNFILNVPVEKLTECKFYLEGEGCPNFIKTIFIAPNAVINMTGEDCMYPMWKVESTLPEQVTANRIMEHARDAIINLLRMGTNSDYMEYVKKTLEIIPSLPVDAASLAELRDASRSANNIFVFWISMGNDFYTSDFPIVVSPHVENVRPMYMGLAQYGGELTMPLSPGLALSVYDRSYFKHKEDIDGAFVNADDKEVRRQNCLRYMYATQHVFSYKNDFSLIDLIYELEGAHPFWSPNYRAEIISGLGKY